MSGVVQKIKVLKTINGLNFEKRLEIKENGRPMPELEIRQTSKDRNKEVHRNFRPSMYDLSEWICGCDSDILASLEKIIDTDDDSNTINQAIGLKNFLQNDNFLYWLNFFHLIMPSCEHLFEKLQKRNIDVNSVKNSIAAFKTSIQELRDDNLNKLAEVSLQTPTSSTASDGRKRRRKAIFYSNPCISLEVCDIIISEVNDRFRFSDHLIIAQLFYSDKFEEYKESFPEDILRLIKKRLSSAGAIAILQLFINNNLCDTFLESVKLLNILCTLPMTTMEKSNNKAGSHLKEYFYLESTAQFYK
ncbi:hypothetical protein NQ317_010722 [Molorchus minor]|uniref:Uncharacterized protein n=1 Tax=Molorchus minor TaxID=1323400 RepID=A0ABQ9K734_9CUCU|nr:hypothetical protein NQ317_010722 [Molorchus minor]